MIFTITNNTVNESRGGGGKCIDLKKKKSIKQNFNIFWEGSSSYSVNIHCMKVDVDVNNLII